MRSRRVDIGDVALQVAEAGAGGHPLMFVHGFTGAKEDFTDFLEPLAERGWHAVSPDLRGHGASDHPPGQDAYSFEILAADLLALADALGWDRFTIVGHSMGGALAQRLALNHPSRLAAVGLVATFHGRVQGVDPALVQLGTAIVSQSGMTGLARALEAHRAVNEGPETSFERLVRRRPGYAEWTESKLLATSSELWLALAPRFLDDTDRLVALTTLNLPTAVIVGELDGAMLDDCRRLAAAIPGASLAVIRGAGHSPQFEDAEAWWTALTSFLDAVPVEAGAHT